MFELVAGTGYNDAATVAPAIGVPGGIKVTVPQFPQPGFPSRLLPSWNRFLKRCQ